MAEVSQGRSPTEYLEQSHGELSVKHENKTRGPSACVSTSLTAWCLMALELHCLGSKSGPFIDQLEHHQQTTNFSMFIFLFCRKRMVLRLLPRQLDKKIKLMHAKCLKAMLCSALFSNCNHHYHGHHRKKSQLSVVHLANLFSQSLVHYHKVDML